MSTETVPSRSVAVSEPSIFARSITHHCIRSVSQDAIEKLLRKHNGYGFCTSFFPAYQQPKPVTKTNLKTSTKLVTITTSINPAPTTVTRTATGGAPAESTVLQTSVISKTTTATFTGAPSTTTDVQIVSRIPEPHCSHVRVQPNPLDHCPLISYHGPHRDVHYQLSRRPYYCCSSCQPTLVAEGRCQQPDLPRLHPGLAAPPAKTVSLCKTTTVTRTQTRTATNAHPTIISTTIVTPTAKTVTEVISTTLVLTESTTLAPVITVRARKPPIEKPKNSPLTLPRNPPPPSP
jgi:hypothetical protein